LKEIDNVVKADNVWMANELEKANFSFEKLQLILLKKEIAVNDLCSELVGISIFDQKDNGVDGGTQGADVIVTTKLFGNFNEDTAFCRFPNHRRNDQNNANEWAGSLANCEERMVFGLKMEKKIVCTW
jgi:hypothetical protein